jgi:hypothetical protein
MKKVWLAVVLGVILGLGMGVLPAPTSSPEGLRMPLTPVTQTAGFAARSPLLSQLQLLLVGLAAGFVVAVPVFLIARRRGQTAAT